jgi:hypothetical protein
LIAVIQCAGRKARNAGHLETPAGQPVTFVADPKAVAPSDEALYAHPDDMSGYGWTWREALVKYNEHPSQNPLRLLPASQLYDNPAYGRLFEKFGAKNLFILSAGGGSGPHRFDGVIEVIRKTCKVPVLHVVAALRCLAVVKDCRRNSPECDAAIRNRLAARFGPPADPRTAECRNHGKEGTLFEQLVGRSSGPSKGRGHPVSTQWSQPYQPVQQGDSGIPIVPKLPKRLTINHVRSCIRLDDPTLVAKTFKVRRADNRN